MLTRSIISGLKTAVVVAVSAGLISLIDSIVQALTGTEAPAWLVPWGPALVAVSGVIKAVVKRWELGYVMSRQSSQD